MLSIYFPNKYEYSKEYPIFSFLILTGRLEFILCYIIFKQNNLILLRVLNQIKKKYAIIFIENKLKKWKIQIKNNKIKIKKPFLQKNTEINPKIIRLALQIIFTKYKMVFYQF